MRAVLRSAAAGVIFVATLAFITSACGGGDPAPPVVTEAVRHLEVHNALAGEDLAVAGPDYLARMGEELDFGLSADDGFEILSLAERGPDGLRHARLQQTHAGVVVFGSEVVVHADDTTFLGFNGYLTRHLDGFDTTAPLSADEAMVIAQAETSGEYSGESSRLVVLPGRDGQGAQLAWHLEYLAVDGTRVHRWNYFVDARDGAVRRKFDAVMTEPTEQASGEGGNAIFAKQWTTELDVVADGGEYKMDTDRLQVVDHNTGDPAKGPLDAMPDPIANDAQGYGEITLKMMREWMGHDSIDSSGKEVVQRVHDPACGACWFDDSVHYADTGGYDYPSPGSIDIVGHEINHGFTQYHSNLTYDSGQQSAGLNEAFSSVAGIIVRHYEMGDEAGFQLAREVLNGGGYVEDLCNPTFRGDYIGDANDWTPDVEVHGAGAPAGRAFCLAVGRYKAIGGGSTTDAVREIGRIWYQANASYWTSSATFITSCQGTIDAAQSLGFSSQVVQALRDSWADVGAECAGPGSFVCDNDDSCDAGDGETCASCPDDCGTCSEDCSFWKKAKCKVGIGDCSRCDLAPGCGDGECSGEESDETCGEDCGCAATDGECVLAPFGCYCDAQCVQWGDCCADLADFCQ